MNFIKKIFIDKPDQLVHKQFIRFGIGEFERAYIQINKSKNLKIRTSFDLSNDLFGIIAENIDEKAEVSGKIISNYNFENELKFIKNFTKRGNIYTAEINAMLQPEALRLIYEKFKNSYLLLNVKSNKFILKCEKSLPKPRKELKDNFCSATLPLNLVDEFAFDFPYNFKIAKIYHKYIIEEIIVPEEYKKDYEKARTEGKRKGKIIRYLNIDGKEKQREADLLV